MPANPSDDFLDLELPQHGAENPTDRGETMPDVDVSESTMAALRARSLENHEEQSALIMGGLSFSSEALRAGIIKQQNETAPDESAALSKLLANTPPTN